MKSQRKENRHSLAKILTTQRAHQQTLYEIMDCVRMLTQMIETLGSCLKILENPSTEKTPLSSNGKRI